MYYYCHTQKHSNQWNESFTLQAVELETLRLSAACSNLAQVDVIKLLTSQQLSHYLCKKSLLLAQLLGDIWKTPPHLKFLSLSFRWALLNFRDSFSR